MKISLTLICLLLGGIIYYQATHYPRTEEGADHSSPEDGVIDANQTAPFRAKPLRAYAEVVRRPLFSENRRPPAVENVQVEDSIDISDLEDLVLFGVVISGATKYAIVGNRKADTAEQIKEGHRYKGWRVSEISSDRIQFEGKDGQYELFISPDDSNKKSGLRSTPRTQKTPVRQSVFRGARQKRESPIKIPNTQKVPRAPAVIEDELDEEIDIELLEKLSEEGGFEFDLDAQFDEDDLEE